MKKLKKMLNEEIQIEINKTRAKQSDIKELMAISLILGVILLMSTPILFLVEAAAFAKSSLVVGLLQSLFLTGFMLKGFSLSDKEDKLVKELKLREEIKRSTEEYQKEYLKTNQHIKVNLKIYQDENLQNKDVDDTKTL